MKSLINGLGRLHPDEQEEPEHPTALCTSYPSIRTWRITRARTGLSPPAGYLYKPWDRVASKCGHQPGTTPALTSTTLALRKDTLVYSGP